MRQIAKSKMQCRKVSINNCHSEHISVKSPATLNTDAWTWITQVITGSLSGGVNISEASNILPVEGP